MTDGAGIARTPDPVSGRFRLTRLLLLAALALSAAGACGPREPPPDAAGPPDVQDPPIRSGPSTPASEAAAGRLLATARDALQGGAWRTALEAAMEVVEEHPAASGSSRALLMGARAALELERYGRADTLGARYTEVLPPGDARRIDAVLIQGRARVAMGRFEEGVTILLGIEESLSGPQRQRALGIVRDASRELDTPRLQFLVEGPASRGALAAPVMAELAVARYLQGYEEEAMDLADRSLALAVDEADRRLARAVLEGNLEDVLGGAVPLAAVLPQSGSPSLRRIAALIEEGVQVRVDQERSRARRPVELRVLDGAGEASTAAALYRDAEGGGALGVVGPLQEMTLDAVARARTRPVPLISPTARRLPSGARAVYSLGAPDPGAARALAEYANRAGFRTAALVYPRTPEAELEARAFREAFRGRVLADNPYPPGSTFFQAQLAPLGALRPEALVLPVPASDLESLAPQVSFFGLDTLNIRVLGTAGWTSQGVLDAVENRHTDSVVSVAARAPGQGDSAWNAFVRDYETTLQKSLRSPVPALGYDAAGLLLEAIRTGARTPGDVARALEGIRDFPGATGSISILDGRIVRRWFPVLVVGGTIHAIDPDALPPVGPLPPPAPDTGGGGSPPGGLP